MIAYCTGSICDIFCRYIIAVIAVVMFVTIVEQEEVMLMDLINRTIDLLQNIVQLINEIFVISTNISLLPFRCILFN